MNLQGQVLPGIEKFQQEREARLRMTPAEKSPGMFPDQLPREAFCQGPLADDRLIFAVIADLPAFARSRFSGPSVLPKTVASFRPPRDIASTGDESEGIKGRHRVLQMIGNGKHCSSLLVPKLRLGTTVPEAPPRGKQENRWRQSRRYRPSVHCAHLSLRGRASTVMRSQAEPGTSNTNYSSPPSQA